MGAIRNAFAWAKQAVARKSLKSAVSAAPLRPHVGPPDAFLMGTVLALVAFGVVMVYSASAVFASQQFHNGQHFLIRQSLYALGGIALMFIFTRIDYHRLRRLTYVLLAGSIALMLYVALGFGHAAGGAARWISVGPVHIQPAETAKVAIIFWLAYSLSKKADRIRTFTVGFLPHALMACLLMLLCLKQPDFGSAMMIGLITFVLLFTAGAKTGYIFAAILMFSPIAYLLVTGSEYRMRRIQAFLAPFEHRYDIGYQISESLMSFGSGGVAGVGIGDSRQKLFFLPEAHTDFISAIVGEELGFVGIMALVFAFGLVVYLGLRAAFRAADDYGTYLAVGITMFVGIQAFTNLAVAMGLVPTKGLVLPFISFGGSSLLVNCAAMGVLLNVSRERSADVEMVEKKESRNSSVPAMRATSLGGST
ncbi:MAG: putative lipid II flippase FtsW [Sandaracinaceae bacterium]|nr:putative lipid II flippase FtsW [Sandaracinaceae bacterium]